MKGRISTPTLVLCGHLTGSHSRWNPPARPPIHSFVHGGEKVNSSRLRNSPRIGEREGGLSCICEMKHLSVALVLFLVFFFLSSPLFPFLLLLSCCFALICVTAVMLLCGRGVMCSCFSHTFHIKCLLPATGRNASILGDRSMEGWGLGPINQSIDERRICSVRFVAEICNYLGLPPWGSSCMITRRRRGFHYPYCRPEWFP